MINVDDEWFGWKKSLHYLIFVQVILSILKIQIYFKPFGVLQWSKIEKLEELRSRRHLPHYDTTRYSLRENFKCPL